MVWHRVIDAIFALLRLFNVIAGFANTKKVVAGVKNIKELKQINYCKNGEEETCAICLENFKEGDTGIA